MAALADYLDLRFAVGDQVGNRDLADVMSRLVLMAEASLNHKLRCRQQITDATLTFTDGVAPLPADFLEMISLFDGTGRALRAGSIADTKVSGSQYWRYAVDGTNVLQYGYSGDREARYFAKLTTITTAPTSSNWLLAGYPDVYLYAVSYEAAKHLSDADRASAAAGLLNDAMQALKVDDDRARWSNATVRIQGLTP